MENDHCVAGVDNREEGVCKPRRKLGSNRKEGESEIKIPKSCVCLRVVTE